MLFIDSETNLQMDTVYCDESVSKQGHRNRNEDITKRKLIERLSNCFTCITLRKIIKRNV